jgi:RNA polymerase sigma factor (sigma-70 family)
LLTAVGQTSQPAPQDAANLVGMSAPQNILAVRSTDVVSNAGQRRPSAGTLRLHHTYLRDGRQICLRFLDNSLICAVKCGHASVAAEDTIVYSHAVAAHCRSVLRCVGLRSGLKRLISASTIPVDWASMVSNANTRMSLLERLCDGADPMAWDDFFRRYWPFVFSVARQQGCKDHTAEEIVQEVMLAVFEKKAVFQHDPARGRFRDWLGGVVRNKVIARRRRPEERCHARGGPEDPLAEIESSAASPDAQWEAAFDHAVLSFLLDKVRTQVHPQTYQAFEAVTFGECSGAEAARLTGLSQNAVYQARKNVLRRLRELGATFRRKELPDERLREAIRSRPGAVVERSLTRRTEQTEMRSEPLEAGESS